MCPKALLELLKIPIEPWGTQVLGWLSYYKISLKIHKKLNFETWWYTLFIEVAKNGHKDFAELLLQNNVSDFRGYEASIKMTLPRTYH